MATGGLAFLVLVALAVGAWEVQRLVGRRSPLLQGVGFLLLGVLAGGHVLGVLPRGIVIQLVPVVLVGIAWLGLLYGLQVDLRIVRRLRPWHRTTGVLLPLLPALGAGGLMAAAGATAPQAVLISAVASVSSPRVLELLLHRRIPAERALVRLLRLVMAFSGIPAVLLLAAGSTLLDNAPVSPAPALLLVLGFGALAGYALGVLTRRERERIRLIIVLLGTMAATAGAAAALGHSPLVPAALAGALVVNRTGFPHRLLRAAHDVESPLYIALLVLIGAAWIPSRFDLAVFLALTAGRGLGWVAAGATLQLVAKRHDVPLVTSWPGLGWLPQGPLAMGMLLAVVEVLPGANGVLEAGIGAVIVNHLVGRAWAKRKLPLGDAA